MTDRRIDTLPGMRPRLASHREEPEAPAPEHVYRMFETVEGRVAVVEGRLSGVEGIAQELKLSQATALVEIKSLASTDRHATTKLFVGLVVSVISVIGGQRLLAPGPAPAPVPITRSALDVRLDVCRPIAPGPSREECFARVVAETEH